VDKPHQQDDSALDDNESAAHVHDKHDANGEPKAPKHIPKGKKRQHARRVELALIDDETF
jgi:hypothetical protein